MPERKQRNRLAGRAFRDDFKFQPFPQVIQWLRT